MRSTSATEIVTSPATTAPLLSTRSRVSHSETRSLLRIEMRFIAVPCRSGILIGVRPFAAVAASLQFIEAVEDLLLAKVKLPLVDRASFQAPMQFAELCRQLLTLLVQLLLRSLMDLPQNPENKLARRENEIIDQQHCSLSS